MSPDSLEAYLDGLSSEARALMEQELRRVRAPVPAPNDIKAWTAAQAEVERRSRPACDRARERFEASIEEGRFGSLPALTIETKTVSNARPPLVFLHGGAYTLFSARSSLFASIPLAAELQRKVIALDYPLAPAHRFDRTVPTTAAALSAVMEAFPNACLLGDSAGGGLAVAACNALLKGSGRLPAAVVLLSPWTDLGRRGDSRLTQREHDPVLSWEQGLDVCAAAYAETGIDRPEASPVLADYDSRFPPTLLVCGSREILLSDALRLHRKLVEGGADARLDVHDGLHHSFPVVTPLTPEARRARVGIGMFLDRFSGAPV